MRKFEFRLAKVREFRHAVEEQRKTELQEVQMRIMEAEMEVTRLEQETARTRTEAASSLQDLLHRDALLNRLADDIASQLSVIAIIRRDEEEARQIWIEARKEAKALDQLHEVAKQEYEAAANREEQAALDEWATMRRKAA